MDANLQTDGIEVFGSVTGEFVNILTPEALQFVGRLAREFESRRRELLEARMERQREIDGGKLPDFLPETRDIREGKWKIAPVPEDLGGPLAAMGFDTRSAATAGDDIRLP